MPGRFVCARKARSQFRMAPLCNYLGGHLPGYLLLLYPAENPHMVPQIKTLQICPLPATHAMVHKMGQTLCTQALIPCHDQRVRVAPHRRAQQPSLLLTGLLSAPRIHAQPLTCNLAETETYAELCRTFLPCIPAVCLTAHSSRTGRDPCNLHP
jgi:hypothetical protein